MLASRTSFARLIPYNAPNLTFDGATALQKRIVDFVGGVRGNRKNPVTEKQILDWFNVTDADFVREQLQAVCDDGRIRICRRSLSSGRRHNGGYVYVVAS